MPKESLREYLARTKHNPNTPKTSQVSRQIDFFVYPDGRTISRPEFVLKELRRSRESRKKKRRPLDN